MLLKNATETQPKMIVILGPTACGKTSWGLDLAKKYGGEIISADSRQIYKHMTIGTAKVNGKWKRNGLRKTYYVDDIPHHLLDFLNPGRQFTVAEFRDKAIKYGKLAHKHGRIPMVVGGTGLYIHALVDNFQIPRITANKKLRKSFEEKTSDELLLWLEKMDPVSAKKIDPKNKRRIIRALEVSILTGSPFSEQRKKGESIFNILQIGISVPRDILYERINTRVDEMMRTGLIDEIKQLLRRKYSWELPSMSGIGYRQFKDYFDGKYSLSDAIERLKRDTRRYAKRQLTWFKRDQRIQWCQTYEQAEHHVATFLDKTYGT